VANHTGAPKREADTKLLYIRRFNNGVLEREDKLTRDEIKAIFKGVWTQKKVRARRAGVTWMQGRLPRPPASACGHRGGGWGARAETRGQQCQGGAAR